jgi:hypothetical protein
MIRLVISLWLVVLVAPSAKAQGSRSTSQTRVLQNEWHHCLNESYRFELKKIGERNAAAENAFAACKSEEDHLLEYFVATTETDLGFYSLKAAMKDLLIKDGKLKLLN